MTRCGTLYSGVAAVEFPKRTERTESTLSLKYWRNRLHEMDCRRYRRNHPESMSISGCMFKPGAQKHWWPVLKHGTLSLMSFNNTDLWNRFGRPRRGDLNNNRLELTQVLQPSLSALSASAPCSIVFILLHYLT